LYAWSGEGVPNGVAFHARDVLEVLDVHNPQWWFVRHVATGVTGALTLVVAMLGLDVFFID
jgi:hypothetical protein